jgi:hypothetical protein
MDGTLGRAILGGLAEHEGGNASNVRGCHRGASENVVGGVGWRASLINPSRLDELTGRPNVDAGAVVGGRHAAVLGSSGLFIGSDCSGQYSDRQGFAGGTEVTGVRVRIASSNDDGHSTLDSGWRVTF